MFNKKNLRNKFKNFFSLTHSRSTMSVHKKIAAQSVQPFGQLYAKYIYIYECLVLLYRKCVHILVHYMYSYLFPRLYMIFMYRYLYSTCTHTSFHIYMWYLCIETCIVHVLIPPSSPIYDIYVHILVQCMYPYLFPHLYMICM